MRLAKTLIATVGIPEAPTTCRLMPVNNKWPNPFASVSRVTLLNRLLSSFTSASVRKHRQSLKHWSNFANWRPSPKGIWPCFAKLWSLPGRHTDHWLPQVLLVPPGREPRLAQLKPLNLDYLADLVLQLHCFARQHLLGQLSQRDLGDPVSTQSYLPGFVERIVVLAVAVTF